MISLRQQNFVALFVFCLSILFSGALLAYPNSEKAQVAITDVTAQAVQTYLTSDNRYLYVGFNNKVKIIDLGAFALKSSGQPYDFGADTDFSGIVGGLTLSANRLYVSKDDGKILSFDLTDLTAKPTSITISSGTELGKMAINSAKTKLYIVNKDDNNIILYTISSTESTTINLSSSVGGVSITDMKLVSSVAGGNDYIYVATNKGLIFYIVGDNTTATQAVVGDNTDNIASVAMRPGNTALYAINSTDKSLLVLNPTSLSVTATVELLMNQSGADKTYNESPVSVVSTSVTNPTSTYTFVSGLSGISVFNSNNVLIDANSSGSYTYNPITISGSRYGPLVASGGGYIYESNTDGSLSVVTANPYLTALTVAYSSGTTLGVGGSVTLTFQSEEAGTYNVRVGGSVNQSGTAVVDTTGASTGSVTAATDTTFTFNYDDNSSNLAEGANNIFVFVTDSVSDVGRKMTNVSVDTPPPAVVVTNTGFGANRIYVNFTRLTASDMSYYNIYVSTDADAVVNKTVTATRVNQPSSGTTVAGEVSGLSDGVLYYASIEAVDAAGNVGPLTTTLTDGSRITGSPEQTVGPAELSGETGCQLIKNSKVSGFAPVAAVTILFMMSLYLLRRRASLRAGRGNLVNRHKRAIIIASAFAFLFMPSGVLAGESSKWWSTEVKGGFWIPQGSTTKTFFDTCCNMTASVVQGFLYDSKYGAELGAGYMSQNGTAVGLTTKTQAQDRFNLFLIPMETNFAFRADFTPNQIIVPYVKAGVNYVYFRQSLRGKTINGFKTGLQATGGVQILLDFLDPASELDVEEDFGINDIYFTLEGRYNWVNNFGGKGLNLSSIVCSFGLLFEY